MVELFQDYWWLLFPLAWFVAGGWSSWMRYRRHQANLDLVKTYAASGKEPPASLMDAIARGGASVQNRHDYEDEDDYGHGRHGGGGNAFVIFLFAGLSAVFAVTGYLEVFGDAESMYFVAAILAVLCLAFLGSSMFSGKRRND
ncbi:MAG: hypothetical protein P8J78_04115 [Maricaulis sp.]|nr:hypothetical protein [Maricaulis sp.]